MLSFIQVGIVGMANLFLIIFISCFGTYNSSKVSFGPSEWGKAEKNRSHPGFFHILFNISVCIVYSKNFKMRFFTENRILNILAHIFFFKVKSKKDMAKIWQVPIYFQFLIGTPFCANKNFDIIECITQYYLKLFVHLRTRATSGQSRRSATSSSFVKNKSLRN